MSDYLNVVYNDDNHPLNSYPAKLIDYLFNKYNLNKNQKLLEPGVGRGEFLNEFHNLGLECFGCDLSKKAGEKLNKNIPIITQIDFNKNKLPYPNDYFDIVYSKSLMEHLINPEFFLSEVYRILKPGGKILCLIPDWEANYKIYFDDHTHKTPFTKESLKNILKICDFKFVDTVRFRQLPIVWKYPFLNWLSWLISPFVPVRAKNKFLRWSRELMLIGYGEK